MASAGSTPSRGRKSLDAELNLVPFIDLLSMCICFLLMTAVWMEIGALQVKQLVGTIAAPNSQIAYEMDLKFMTPEKMEVGLTHPGKKVQKFIVEAPTKEAVVSQLEELLKGLVGILKINPGADAKAQMGRTISVARVATKKGVAYGELVAVMDTLRDHGIINLGVVPVRE